MAQPMGFWDHVEELRGVLLRIALILAALTVVYFAAMPAIFDSVILAPCRGDFILYRLLARLSRLNTWFPDFSTEGFSVHLINIQLASQFFIHMSTSFWLAAVTSFPIAIYLLWRFIAPGLYEHEKRGARRAYLLGNLMFFAGVAVGYFLVFPLTLRFLADYHVSDAVPNQISLDSYIDTFMMLIFVMGLVFELPAVAWVLGKIGLLKRHIFRQYRRHAIVALLILAAIITPTGDPFTLLVVFLPIYCLWEIAAFTVPLKAEEDATASE